MGSSCMPPPGLGRRPFRPQRPEGLVRITLKRAYTDGAVADMDPVSLLCRVAASVPPPRFDTIPYAGVLAPASRWRSRIVPPQEVPARNDERGTPERAGAYRPWAELLARTFAADVLSCSRCQGRMKLLAIVEEPSRIARDLAALGEPPGVRVTCPGCQSTAAVPASRAAVSLRGGRCGTTFRLESPPPSAAPPPSPLPTAAAASTTAAVEADAAGAEWRIGDVIMGLYEVTDALGQGGMVRVYEVRHQGWNVDLAVK